jgi:DNA-binding NarL/FixJ family response regulator
MNNIGKNINILLVDNDELTQIKLTNQLQKNKLNVYLATQEEDVFQIMKKERIDLILIDFQVISQTKQTFLSMIQSVKPDVCVIAFSIDEESNEQEYVDGIIPKTCTAERLISFIHDAFHHKFNPLYDFSTLEQMSNGNSAFVEKMKHVFSVSVEENILKIENCVVENDIDGVKKIVHKLKPSIQHLNIYALKDIIEKIEKEEWNSTNLNLFKQYTSRFCQILVCVSTALTYEEQ